MATSIHELYGKKVDMFSLKNDVRSNYSRLSSTHHAKIYSIFSKREVKHRDCPVCGTYTENKPLVVVHGGVYLKCDNCSHFFVGNSLDEQETVKFYENDKQYSSTYTDVKTANLRVTEVSIPKAKWVLEEFKRKYGYFPKKVLDVGAGAGHVVKAFKDLGIDAQGIEISKDAVKFAKEVFNLNLDAVDFVSHHQKYITNPPDVIMFWGVLEHVHNPSNFLDSARKILIANEGSIVSAVPNINSGSTVVQSLFDDETTYRNISPEAHLHMFSLKSIDTLYNNNGVVPFSRWFIGMDAYEFWTQLVTCNRIEYLKENKDTFLSKIKEALDKFSVPNTVLVPISNLVNFIINAQGEIDHLSALPLIEELQKSFDLSRSTDEIITMGKVIRDM